MMKKRILVLVSLLTILLSGCITLRIETKIKKDGSGSKSFVMAFDKSVINMLESMADESDASADDIWAGLRAEADAIEGAKVEEYSDDEVEGIKVSVPFADLKELETLSGSDAFEGADVVTTSEDGDTMTLKAVVTAGDLTSQMGEAGGQELEGFDLGEIELEYTYAVDVEGKILEYTPKDIAEVKGSKVTWNLSHVSDETIDLMVKWEPGGGPDMLVILLVAVALGGVILVVIGVMLSVRDRRRSDQLYMS
jgi:hypothetical protein